MFQCGTCVSAIRRVVVLRIFVLSSSRRRAPMPSFVVPPRSSRRLVISSSFAQPSCAIIICYQHRAFESSLAAKLAPCILVKLVMSGVALHHCSTISLLEACATLFDADSGPSKPIAHPWSHAILLCRMLLGHRAPRTALRMCGCCIAAAATHCHAGHHRLAIACRTRPLSASRSAADSQPIRRTSWSQAVPLCRTPLGHRAPLVQHIA